MTMADVDLVTHVASLPAAYARALQVTLTGGENARMWKAARPTRSLQALEQFTRGQAAFAEGANDRAVALIVRAVEIDPGFVIAHYTLGIVHEALKNRWKAAAQFRASIQLDPTMPEPYKAMGDLVLGAPRGLFDMAIEAYSRAIELRPFYADAHVGLGDARAAKGDVDGALAAYLQAVTFDPFSPRTHLRLGTIYRTQARCSDAVNAFQRALDLDPHSDEARNSVAAISATSC
jgi:tetratricopeptide (TPR) repeat protein